MEKSRIISIPEGTELNSGVHNDGDPLNLERDVEAEVMTGLIEGSITVKILDENGEPIEPPVSFHQPIPLVGK